MATGGYNPLHYNHNDYAPLQLPLFPFTRPPVIMQPFQPYPQFLHKSAANLVRIVNSFEKGKCPLKEILKIFDAREENDKQHIQKLLNDTEKNFEIERIFTNSQEPFYGEEWVQVFTKLTLCSYHCKKGKDGRNRKCHGQCGALHLCRTFLLKSSEQCHFSKKGQCMFGHDFNSKHNWKLLKEHNLDMLGEAELRQLFRRPTSRCRTTIPQVCRYYNNNSNTNKKCTNKHCMSLHICLKFILDKDNHETCSKNHSFEDEQVKKCLDLYEIKGPWKTKDIYDLVQQFTRLEKPSDSDEVASETYSDVGSNHSRRSSSSATSDTFYPYSGAERSQDSCHGCTELLKNYKLLKEEVTALKLEVEKLKAKQEPQATHARILEEPQATRTRICPVSDQ